MSNEYDELSVKYHALLDDYRKLQIENDVLKTRLKLFEQQNASLPKIPTTDRECMTVNADRY